MVHKHAADDGAGQVAARSTGEYPGDLARVGVRRYLEVRQGGARQRQTQALGGG